ncbi:hypothetical protein OS12_12470 [Dickeya oryzae]
MPYLLEMKNITKAFGAVKAVDNVSLQLEAGQVLSLCGENGSGKSTLMKVLCAVYPYGSYEGSISFAGDELRAGHIRDTEQKRDRHHSSGAGAGQKHDGAGKHLSWQ